MKRAARLQKGYGGSRGRHPFVEAAATWRGNLARTNTAARRSQDLRCIGRFIERAVEQGAFVKTRTFSLFGWLALTLGITFGASGLGDAHSGIVDGYGCHRGADKKSYHCHQGQFAGRTFKSKEDFLRQLRGGKSEQLAPKSNAPQLEKKVEE